MDIGVCDGSIVEDISPTNVPVVKLDPFESDNEAADGNFQTGVDGIRRAGNRHQKKPTSTYADEISSRPFEHLGAGKRSE